MKKADKLFVNDVVEFLNDANGYAPTKKSVKILFNCLDYNDMGFRFAICESNAYCGIDCAIFTYSGMYYAAFHVRNDIYELHRISDNTYNNMARLMMYDVYPHTTRRIVKTNLDVRQGQSKMLREDIMDICMMCYRKKIHDTRELEY